MIDSSRSFPYPKCLHLDGYQGIVISKPGESHVLAIIFVVDGAEVYRRELYTFNGDAEGEALAKAAADSVTSATRVLDPLLKLPTHVLQDVADFCAMNRVESTVFNKIVSDDRPPASIYNRPGTFEYLYVIDGESTETIDASTPDGKARLDALVQRYTADWT